MFVKGFWAVHIGPPPEPPAKANAEIKVIGKMAGDPLRYSQDLCGTNHSPLPAAKLMHKNTPNRRLSQQKN
ncbi:hypothetical protein NOVOSPHI9U_310014 [Novosphingobium sp. 9U]|nr:hypothetical protein NOVOSPHI9U_310014 [Novosphingobium sp. 9U]